MWLLDFCCTGHCYRLSSTVSKTSVTAETVKIAQVAGKGRRDTAGSFQELRFFPGWQGQPARKQAERNALLWGA